MARPQRVPRRQGVSRHDGRPMELAVVAVCALLGLLFGSFGNVVIHRIPEGGSIAFPPSACPHCETAIRPIDNVPVVSFLLLRGRCRACGASISMRYPLVELTGGILFALVAWWLVRMDPPDWYALPAYLLFVWVLLVVSVIDARTRRIPNRLTYPLTPALLVLLGAAAIANGRPDDLLRSVLGGVAAFVFLLVLALINPKGMGMGDVKLAAFLGLGLGYVGWGNVVLGLFGSFLLGSVVSLVLIATKTRGRKDLIPFGPYLAAGSLLALLWGRPLLDWYLRITGLA